MRLSCMTDYDADHFAWSAFGRKPGAEYIVFTFHISQQYILKSFAS